MKEQLYYLNNLLECLTSPHSSKSFSDLNAILKKYTKILNFVNCYNDAFKSATAVYYTDMNSIWDNIQVSLNPETQKEKNSCFDTAKNKLKKNIQALAILIIPEEELVEMAI